PDADIKLQTLALTREQAQHFQLPRVPIKDSDLRKAGFEERHGEGAVELDALEALHPGELGRLVRGALDPYLDETLAERLEATAEDAQAVAAAQWLAQSQPWRAELTQIQEEAEEIYSRFQDELERLSAALEQELAPLRQALQQLELTVMQAMAAF